MTARYMPSIVLIVLVLLVVAGIPADALAVPGTAFLIGSLIAFAPAELHNTRGERRKPGRDRRHA